MEIKTFGQALDNRYVNEGDGGGATGGKGTIVADFVNNTLSVTTSGLTSFEDVPKDLLVFDEPVSFDLTYTPSESSGMEYGTRVYNTSAQHGFQLYNDGTEALEYLLCTLTGINSENAQQQTITTSTVTFAVYREYANGEWSDWAYGEDANHS